MAKAAVHIANIGDLHICPLVHTAPPFLGKYTTLPPKRQQQEALPKKIYRYAKKYLDKKKRQQYNIFVVKPYSDFRSESL
jgi:hypothetical protein